MMPRERETEISRLVEAFEIEAAKFHDLQYRIYFVTPDGPQSTRAFDANNHAITLWQYFGTLANDDDVERLVESIEQRDPKWGLVDCELTCFGVIEGDQTPMFVRMAKRAGSLFDSQEINQIENGLLTEIRRSKQSAGVKPTASINTNPLAIWLNYLLFHLSMAYPGRERETRIEPDPFSLSLLALERLAKDKVIGKADRSTRKLSDLQFKVGVSFPGEKRRYVSRVVDTLRMPLGADSVFYDMDYQAQLARPNLDTLLQNVYRHQTDLVVVFLCDAYASKEWCGLEWRAIRDIIKSKSDEQVMFIRFDDVDVEGLFSIDGYIDGNKHNTRQVADFILKRLDGLK